MTDAETQTPFDGYDRLGQRAIMDRLSDHTQVELAGIESYERSHQNRLPVLDKLRYMRSREPFDGYDAFSAEQILAALQESDLDGVKRVRDYERKFANRPDVIATAARVQHERQESRPAAPVPAYKPASAS